MLNYDNVVTVSRLRSLLFCSLPSFFFSHMGLAMLLSFFSDSDSYHNNVVSMENSSFGADLLKGCEKKNAKSLSYFSHRVSGSLAYIYEAEKNIKNAKNYSSNYANSFKTCKILHFQLVTLNNKFAAVRNSSGAGQ